MSEISEFHIQRAFTIYFQGERWARGPLEGQWKVEPASLPGVISWHTPNGGKRSGAEAKQFREMGVVAGMPDYFFLQSGRLFALEFKRPGGTLSKAQLDLHPLLRAAGIVALETVDNLADAKAFVRKHGLVLPNR